MYDTTITTKLLGQTGKTFVEKLGNLGQGGTTWWLCSKDHGGYLQKTRVVARQPPWSFMTNHPGLPPTSTMAFHHLHLYVLLEPTRTTYNNNFFFRAAHEEAVGTRPSRTALMRFGLPRDEVGARSLPFARFPTFGIHLLFLVIINPYFKF